MTWALIVVIRPRLSVTTGKISCISVYRNNVLDLTATIIASEASVAVTPEDVATLVDAVALVAGVRVARVNLNCVLK